VSDTKNISKLKRIEHFPTFNTQSKHRDELIRFVRLTEINPTKLRPIQETDLIGNIMELVDRSHIGWSNNNRSVHLLCLYLFEYQDGCLSNEYKYSNYSNNGYSNENFISWGFEILHGLLIHKNIRISPRVKVKSIPRFHKKWWSKLYKRITKTRLQLGKASKKG
jgi:hypothetical protein